jgi:hypothetical protein
MTRIGKRLSVVVGVSALLFSIAAGVKAGVKSEGNVTINTFATYRYGAGALGTARASADANQQIGCRVEATTGGNFARCIARTSAGAYLECTTGSAAIVQAAAAIGPATRIYFTENLNGTCTGLHTQNESNWKPMVP